MSLEARARLFNQRYVVVGISASKLGKVYAKEGVKYKLVKHTKVLN